MFPPGWRPVRVICPTSPKVAESVTPTAAEARPIAGLIVEKLRNVEFTVKVVLETPAVTLKFALTAGSCCHEKLTPSTRGELGSLGFSSQADGFEPFTTPQE